MRGRRNAARGRRNRRANMEVEDNDYEFTSPIRNMNLVEACRAAYNRYIFRCLANQNYGSFLNIRNNFDMPRNPFTRQALFDFFLSVNYEDSPLTNREARILRNAGAPRRDFDGPGFYNGIQEPPVWAYDCPFPEENQNEINIIGGNEENNNVEINQLPPFAMEEEEEDEEIRERRPQNEEEEEYIREIESDEKKLNLLRGFRFIKAMPMIGEGRCPICLEEKVLKITMCGHGICKNCLLTDLKIRGSESPKCPDCRKRYMEGAKNIKINGCFSENFWNQQINKNNQEKGEIEKQRKELEDAKKAFEEEINLRKEEEKEMEKERRVRMQQEYDFKLANAIQERKEELEEEYNKKVINNNKALKEFYEEKNKKNEKEIENLKKDKKKLEDEKEEAIKKYFEKVEEMNKLNRLKFNNIIESKDKIEIKNNEIKLEEESEDEEDRKDKEKLEELKKKLEEEYLQKKRERREKRRKEREETERKIKELEEEERKEAEERELSKRKRAEKIKKLRESLNKK